MQRLRLKRQCSGRARLQSARYLVGGLIALALLAWILRDFDLSRTGQALRSADYVWLLPAGLAMLGMFALRALRWRLLLRPTQRASLSALWWGVLVGYFGNFALTANAGELVRAFVLGRGENRSKSAVLASIAVEKTLDILVLVGTLALLSLGLALPRWAAWMMALGGLMFATAGLALVFLPRWEARIGILGERIFGSLAARVEGPLRAFVSGLYFPRGAALVGVLVLSCLVWSVLAVAFFFIGQSLNFSIAAQAYLLLAALITLGAIVPTLPGQVGTTEFLAAGGLGLFAVGKEQALAFVILLRLVRLLPLSLGYVGLLRAGLGKNFHTSSNHPET